MCGIAGVINLDGAPLKVDRLKLMVDALAHRGPDDAGYLVYQTGRHHPTDEGFGQELTDQAFGHLSPQLPAIDSPAGRTCLEEGPWDLCLGHRRLTILDLTPRGHQPMSDRTRNTWLVHNGEVYNFRELRVELEKLGYCFRSRTDAEVILYAYEAWGPDCIHRFNGMFAFALWDNRHKRLVLARDRYGIKPLYWTRRGDCLVFASEIKAILAWCGTATGVDLLALNEYFSFQNVLTDRTLFDGIRLLRAGHIVQIDAANGSVETRQYWDFDFGSEIASPREEIEEHLKFLLQQAVRRQCVADVAIGSYLSGGMDSGTVTALTSSVLGRIFTFTLGFDLSEAAAHEMTFDEREQAERLANLLQTEHYESVLHSGDMEAVLHDLVWSLEDLRLGQCYPNYYVARLASKFVKVVMSGVGGDELFGGYAWRYAAAVGRDGHEYVQNYYRYWQRLVRNREKPLLFNDDVRSRLAELRENGAVPFKDHTLSVFRGVLGEQFDNRTVSSQVRNALYFECKTFLPGLLVIEDKLSMAHSLETRVPFLDNDLVDFACSIPVTMKVSGIDNLEQMNENLLRKKELYTNKLDRGKNILRKAMEQILPREFTTARKQGFSAPDESWFRGRSAAHVQEVLLDGSSPLYRFLSPDYVRKVVDAHCSGRENKRLLIWSLLNFAKWLEHFD